MTQIIINTLQRRLTIRRIINVCLFLVVGITNIQGQRFLQLEIYRQVQTLKFYEGDVIKFRSIAFPDEWQEQQIVKILPDANVLLFDESMINIDDITKVKIVKSGARAAGNILEVFGLAWLGFGGIAAIAGNDNFKFTWGTFAIGATAIAVGAFFKRIVANKTYTIGGNAKLRIINLDLTPLDDGGLPFRFP